MKRFVVALFIFALGCSNDDSLNFSTVFVEEDLQEYFNLFETEAAERGQIVDLQKAGIQGYIESNLNGSIVGQCRISDGERSVTIDAVYWRSATLYEREMLVFHELGHCYLERDHDDGANRNGTCKSIMHSGLTNCRMSYNQLTRSSYLDELFEIE